MKLHFSFIKKISFNIYINKMDFYLRLRIFSIKNNFIHSRYVLEIIRNYLRSRYICLNTVISRNTYNGLASYFSW